ncbi:MAG: cytochrome c [Crocinitomicaceae bacterium]
MNRKFKTLNILAISVIAAGSILTSCKNDPNSPGSEYMPDMYRSPAVETYVDYGQVLGKYKTELSDAYEPGLPPSGTIPMSSNATNDLPYEHGMPVGWDKSHGLYGMPVDSTGYADAAFDLNPIAYTETVKKDAKVLYQNFCIHCHGEKGDGQGTVVTNGGYPPPPSYSGAGLKDLPAGNIFYSITYGKGLMGSHASQLSKEERWKLVHHIEMLQGKDKVTVEKAAEAGTVTSDENVDVDGSADSDALAPEEKTIIQKVVGKVQDVLKTDGKH